MLATAAARFASPVFCSDPKTKIVVIRDQAARLGWGEALCNQVRGIRILRTSHTRSSTKFAFARALENT